MVAASSNLQPVWAAWSSAARARLRPLKYQALWAILLGQAALRGVPRGRLERIHAYLHSHYDADAVRHVHPLQNPRESYFPGLRAKPVYDDREIAWTAQLEEACPRIKPELLDMLGKSKLAPHPQDLADAGSWLVSYFYVQGEEVDATHKACPVTSSLLRSCLPTGPSHQVFCSVLSGGSHIKPHCGPVNTRLTCHLGLVVPEDASIRVGTNMVRWQEGKCLVFDDSFEHEVWNNSEKERVVLLIQFWHPDLTKDEIWALNVLRALMVQREYKKKALRSAKMED
jgi:aspartyl/asparaginyl beta-hydroxylase (cupin superfamily)